MSRTPRVFTTQLAAGVRTVLTEFENAVRLHEMAGSFPEEERELIEKSYDNKRQTLLRKLLRIQNGPNEGSIEQLKRDLRKLSKAYIAIAGTGDAQKLFPAEWKLADDIARGNKRL